MVFQVLKDPIVNRFYLKDSIKNSFLFIPNYYLATIQYLRNAIIDNTLTKELSGPIGIVKMADQLMLDKIKGVLYLFIVISLFVGIFNLVPIPLLDGGHIVYFIIRHIFSDCITAYCYQNISYYWFYNYILYFFYSYF